MSVFPLPFHSNFYRTRKPRGTLHIMFKFGINITFSTVVPLQHTACEHPLDDQWKSDMLIVSPMTLSLKQAECGSTPEKPSSLEHRHVNIMTKRLCCSANTQKRCKKSPHNSWLTNCMYCRCWTLFGFSNISATAAPPQLSPVGVVIKAEAN